MQKKETPAQKIKRLERALRDEKEKNLILNTLVDVFDDEYGASLRKKHLTTHSGGSNKSDAWASAEGVVYWVWAGKRYNIGNVNSSACVSLLSCYSGVQSYRMPRVNGILKGEFLLHRCNTFDELKALVDESVRIYNEVRPHLSLRMQTPQAVHEQHRLVQQKESQIQSVSGSVKPSMYFRTGHSYQ